MLTSVHPKLPMRNAEITKQYYTEKLAFRVLADYGNYLMVEREKIEIHFFEFKDLNPKENYGQIYIRSNDIEGLYQSLINSGTAIHPNGQLQVKPWGQKEFSLLDPDNNLLTFGEAVY